MYKTVLIILVCCISLSMDAQSIFYGVGGSLTNSRMRENAAIIDRPKNMFGFRAFGLLGYNFNDIAMIRLEPGYLVKGAKIKFTDKEEPYRFDYLSVPLLFQYYLTRHMSLIAGPEFNFRSGIKAKSTTATEAATIIFSKQQDIGLHAGLLFDIFDHFEFGLRYTQGFINQTPGLEDAEHKKISFYHNGFEFQLGYKF